MSTPTPLSRTSLSHVALRTPEVERAARFYERVMGMVSGPHPDADGAVLLGWGAGHHVLELLPGPVALDHVAFEVLDDGGHEALGERLRAAGIDVREVGDTLASIEVRDPDGNAVRFHSAVSRVGEFTADTGRRPIRVQHATMATAQMDAMVDFYVALGLRVTDRMGEVFTWLRSTVEHHSVGVVLIPDRDGLDHHSYDLAGWEDFKTWADRLTDIGVPVKWGPGRHGPGNNLYLFFDDPDGNRIELSAEMERFFDDRAEYEPRRWVADPSTINLWGGQLPGWRTT